MSNQATDTETTPSSQTMLHFSYKSIWEHAHCLIGYWWYFILAALAVFTALWTIVGASNYFYGISLTGWHFSAATVCVSCVLAFLRTIQVYLKGCPEGLESESAAAKRIAQIQRPKWEFRLTRQLLQEKLRNLDVELKDLLEGRVFVLVEKQLPLTDYVAWAQVRPINLRQMMDVAVRLLITDLLPAIRSQKDQPAEPAAILSVTNRIRDLYAETITFERLNHTVAPPEALESLHALQCGWTSPIRKGIRDAFRLLDRILEVAPKEEVTISLTIEFEEPPNVEEYCQELARLQPQLPGIMWDEMAS